MIDHATHPDLPYDWRQWRWNDIGHDVLSDSTVSAKCTTWIKTRQRENGPGPGSSSLALREDASVLIFGSFHARGDETQEVIGVPQETLRQQRLDFGERLRRAGSVIPNGTIQQSRHLSILEGRRAKHVGDSPGRSDSIALASLFWTRPSNSDLTNVLSSSESSGQIQEGNRSPNSPINRSIFTWT